MPWYDKPLKKIGLNSVPQRFNQVTDEWEIETTDPDPVYDTEVLNKLNELDAKINGIIEGTTPANTKLTGSTATLQTNVENFPSQFAVSNLPQTQDVHVVNQQIEPELQEQLTEADAVGGVLTFTEPLTYVDIYNQDTVEGIFTINNFQITVPADTFFRSKVAGTPSENVTVTGSSDYIIGRYA